MVSNTYVQDVIAPFANDLYAVIFRSVVTTGGNLTITVTPLTSCVLSMGVDEYSFPPGYVLALDGVVATGTGLGTNQTTGNLSPTTVGLVYGVSTGAENNIGTMTAGSVFTPRYNYSPVPSGKTPIVCEDIAANTTSPIAVTTTASPGSHWAIVGAAYKVTQPPINPIPSRIPANHPNPITIALTGLGTNWTGNPFSVTGDATLVSQQVISTTSAKISVSTSTATGSATISDGTFTATLTVVHATLVMAPPGLGTDQSITVTVTGTNTFWLSEPVSPPLFSVSGPVGTSLSNIVVTGNTAATFTLTSGSATGSATITDNSTTALAATTVFALAAAIAVAPGFIPVSLTNITLALTGTNTNWSGNPFILSGVTGVTLVSQSVTSNTAASIVVSTGTTTGTLTLFDGSYTTTIAVIPGAMVTSRVCRPIGIRLFPDRHHDRHLCSAGRSHFLG